MTIHRTSVPEGLTLSEAKADLYSVDPYYRDGWEALSTACGGEDDAVALTWRSVGVLLRPDALAAGRIDLFLERMSALSLRPVAIRQVDFTRLMIRELWRYQLNIATRQRIRAMDALLLDRPGLLVVLVSETTRSTPVCVGLRSVKGPSNPRRRQPGQLRSLLADVQISAVTLVHSPDEPIDWVRDLGLFLAWDAAEAIVAEILDCADITDHVLRHAHELRMQGGELTTPAPYERDLARSLLMGASTPYMGQTPWPVALSMAEQAEAHVVGLEAVVPDVDPGKWLSTRTCERGTS